MCTSPLALLFKSALRKLGGAYNDPFHFSQNFHITFFSCSVRSTAQKTILKYTQKDYNALLFRFLLSVNFI